MKKDPGPESRFSYLINVIINLIVLYAVQKAPQWNIVFLTDEYLDVQKVLATAIIVQVVTGVVLIVLHTIAMHYLMHVITNFVTVYAVYRLIVVFPFDFALIGLPFIGKVLKIMLIISLIATLIGLISTMVKLRYVLKEKE